MISLFKDHGSFEVAPNQKIGDKLKTDSEIRSDENELFFIYLLREHKDCLIAEHIFKELNGNLNLSEIRFNFSQEKSFRYRLLIIKAIFIENEYEFMLSNCFTFLTESWYCKNFNDPNSSTNIRIPSPLSHNSTDITIPLYFSLNRNFLCQTCDPEVIDQRLDPSSVKKYIEHSSNLIEKFMEVTTHNKQNIDQKAVAISSALTQLANATKEKSELKKKIEALEKTNEKLRDFIKVFCSKKQKVEKE